MKNKNVKTKNILKKHFVMLEKIYKLKRELKKKKFKIVTTNLVIPHNKINYLKKALYSNYAIFKNISYYRYT